jgi:hypothetical protein
MTIPSPKTIETFKMCQWAALCRGDILWATYYTSRQLLDQGIPGDLVECGVFAGTHPAMMARAIIDHAQAHKIGVDRLGRRVHLFDSFEGVPEPTPEDEGYYGEERRAGKLKRGTACSREQVEIYLEQWGIPSSLLVYHEGWYSDTMPPAKSFPIALLRIDCDYYESVRQVLRYLYPQVGERGICTFDDYAFPGARQAFMEQFGDDANPGVISPLSWWRR